MKLRFSRIRSSGLSLVELMIALALGALLMLGIVEIFTGTKATYNLQEGLSRVQENGRIAMAIVAKDARMGGLLGCATSTNTTSRILRVNPVQVPSTFVSHINPAAADQLLAFPQVGLEGYEFVGTDLGSTLFTLPTAPVNADATEFAPELPDSDMFTGAIVPARGSDILVVRYSLEPAVSVVSSTNNAQTITADDTLLPAGVEIDEALPQQGIFAVSDCIRGNVFQGTRAAGSFVIVRDADGASAPGNVSVGGVPVLYGKNAIITERVTVVYFVGANGRGGYSLYRGRYTFPAGVPVVVKDELVEGVENMQLMFGIPAMTVVERGSGITQEILTAPVRSFATAEQIADPNFAGFGDTAATTSAFPAHVARAFLLRRLNTRSVRISMLLSSGDNARTDIDTRTYGLFGASAATAVDIDPPDNRAYRDVFETTIQGRNLSTSN
jgi:type IV pilus assembly protein PilW